MSAITIMIQRSLRRCSVALLTIPATLLAGCSLSSLPRASQQATSTAIHGSAFGGQQPISGSTITIWAVGATTSINDAYSTAPILLATTASDAKGNFAFPANAYVCPAPTAQVYLLAQGGNPGIGSGTNSAIALAAGIGNCSTAPSRTVNINEVTTVATAFALAQFFGPTIGNGSQDAFYGPSDINALANANTYTIPTLVNLATGSVNPSTSTFTIESAKIYTIANILAACINSTAAASACTTLFANTTVPARLTPSDTLRAAVLMALYPYQNVSNLFGLISPTAPFQGLPIQPNDFTIAVSYTAPNLGLSIAANTSSNIDIDSTGRIWFPSNKAGATGAAVFDPTSNTFAGPYGGAVAQAPLTSPQYLAIDQDDVVWLTDQASGSVVSFAASNPGSVLAFALPNVTGGPITTNTDNTMLLLDTQAGVPYLSLVDKTTQTLSTQVGLLRQNPTAIASSYNVPPFLSVMASTSTPTSHCLLEDTAFDEHGKYVNETDADSGAGCSSGGIALTYLNADAVSVASSLNRLCSFTDGCFTPAVPLNQPQGIATDGAGSLWIANAGNGSVSTLLGPGPNPSGNAAADYTSTSPIAYPHNALNGATTSTPMGIAIDSAGNVWLSNVCTSSCPTSTFVLSELIGAAAPAITPLSAQYGGAFAGTYPFLATARPPLTTPRVLSSPHQGQLGSHLVMHATSATHTP